MAVQGEGGGGLQVIRGWVAQEVVLSRPRRWRGAVWPCKTRATQVKRVGRYTRSCTRMCMHHGTRGTEENPKQLTLGVEVACPVTLGVAEKAANSSSFPPAICFTTEAAMEGTGDSSAARVGADAPKRTDAEAEAEARRRKSRLEAPAAAVEACM